MGYADIDRNVLYNQTQDMPAEYRDILGPLAYGGAGPREIIGTLDMLMKREQAQREIEQKANEMLLRYQMQGLGLKQAASAEAMKYGLGLDQLGMERDRTASQERSHGKTAELGLKGHEAQAAGQSQAALLKLTGERIAKKDEMDYGHKLKMGELAAEGKLGDRLTNYLEQQSKTGLPIDPLAVSALFNEAASQNPFYGQIHTKLQAVSNTPQEYYNNLNLFTGKLKTNRDDAMKSVDDTYKKWLSQKAKPTISPVSAPAEPLTIGGRTIPYEETLPGLLQGVNNRFQNPPVSDDPLAALMP